MLTPEQIKFIKAQDSLIFNIDQMLEKSFRKVYRGGRHISAWNSDDGNPRVCIIDWN